MRWIHLNNRNRLKYTNQLWLNHKKNILETGKIKCECFINKTKLLHNLFTSKRFVISFALVKRHDSPPYFKQNFKRDFCWKKMYRTHVKQIESPSFEPAHQTYNTLSNDFLTTCSVIQDFAFALISLRSPIIFNSHIDKLIRKVWPLWLNFDHPLQGLAPKISRNVRK